jgi:hypothetical protein
LIYPTGKNKKTELVLEIMPKFEIKLSFNEQTIKFIKGAHFFYHSDFQQLLPHRTGICIGL